MTNDEAAAQLNGNEYRSEGSMVLFESMKIFRLVALFGASDDLAEFRGAINDELVCYGGTLCLTPDGLLENCCDNDRCPYFKKEKERAAKIEPIWDDGIPWRYETAIPHSKFTIMEDGQPYCEGIVFALADVLIP